MKQFVVQLSNGTLTSESRSYLGRISTTPEVFGSFEAALVRSEDLLCGSTVLELVPVAKVTYNRTVTRSIDPLV